MFARLLVLVFAFNILFFVCEGNWNGNDGFVPAMVRITQSPAPLATTVRGTQSAFALFFVDVVGGPMLEVVSGFDDLFFQTINFTKVIDGLHCLVNATYNLPSIEFFMMWINETVGILGNLTLPLERIPGIMAGWGNETMTAMYVMNAQLDALGQNLSDIAWQAQSTINDLNTIDWFFSNLTNSQFGTDSFSKALRTFNTEGDRANRVRGYPSNTIVTDAFSNSPCLSQLYYPGVSSTSLLDRQEIHDKLFAVWYELDYLPRYNQTYQDMVDYNNRIDWCSNRNLFGNFSDNLNMTITAFGSLSGVTNGFAVALNYLFGAIYNLSFDGLVQVVVDINSTLFSIDWYSMHQEINKLYEFGVIVPCLWDILDEFFNVNNTLFEIPPEMANVSSVSATLDSTLLMLYDTANSTSAAVRGFQQAIAAANLSTMVVSIYDMQRALQNATGGDPGNQFIGDMGSMEDQLNNTDVDANFTTVNNIMLNGRVHLPDYYWLVGWEENVTGPARQQLGWVVDDSQYLATGSCNGDSSRECQQSSDCPSGTGPCNPPPINCVIDTSTACTSDAACPGPGDRCRVDNARFAALSAMVAALDSSRVPSVAWSEIYWFDSLTLSLFYDTSDARSGLEGARDALLGVNVTDMQVMIYDMLDEMGLVGGNSSSMEGFGDIGGAMGDIDLGSMAGSLGSSNESFAMLGEVRQGCIDAEGLMQTLLIMHSDIMPQYYALLDPDNLTVFYLENGMSGVLNLFCSMMDNFTAWFESNQTLIGNLTTNLTMEYMGYYARLDAFEGIDWWQYGAVHWLAGISDPFSVVHPTRDATIAPWRLTADVYGQPYPNAMQCLTDECLLNEILYINSEPFTTMEYTRNTPLNILPVGRDQMIAAPYAIPIILMLIGAAMLLPCNPLVKTCGTCSCMLTFTLVPWMFFFSGLFFPLMVCTHTHHDPGSALRVIPVWLCR
jgi:hypothetical protein